MTPRRAALLPGKPLEVQIGRIYPQPRPRFGTPTNPWTPGFEALSPAVAIAISQKNSSYFRTGL
jgi:hypothetical protein